MKSRRFYIALAVTLVIVLGIIIILANKTSPAYMISIKDSAYTDPNVTIDKGTTVEWTNTDSSINTVSTAGNSVGPNSGDMQANKSYKYTFDRPGKYFYYNLNQTSETGTIIVNN